MNAAARLLRERFDELVDALTLRVLEARGGRYTRLHVAALRPQISAGVARLRRDLEEGTMEHAPRFWEEIALDRLRQGLELADVQGAISTTERVLQEACYERIATPFERRRAVERISLVCEAAHVVVHRASVRAQRRLLEEQNEMIRRLSTPILPLHRGVLALPLIGTLDAARAAHITERLLENVVARRAEVVILDVTGVLEINAEVGAGLVRTAQAVRMLGAQVVLAGIGPAVARTMVQHGVELTGIATCANLEAALEHALAALGLSIVRAAR